MSRRGTLSYLAFPEFLLALRWVAVAVIVSAAATKGVQQGEFLGDLIDKRPKDVVPSKQYLETLSSAQLKELWIAALKNQMKVLEENEGPKAPMLHALQSELKEVLHQRIFLWYCLVALIIFLLQAQGFNSALADKEAEKRSRRRA